jgi:hypothetical protein
MPEAYLSGDRLQESTACIGRPRAISLNSKKNNPPQNSIQNHGAVMDGETTYSGRITGIVIMFLGLSSIAAGVAMLFVASDRLMAYIFIGLPCLSLGCIELLSGYATFATRIEIGNHALNISAPAWRGCPWPPVRKSNVSWDEVQAVRHRTEMYHLLPGGGLPFPVEAFAIETEKDRVVLAGKSVPGIMRAIGEIAHRLDCPVVEEKQVQASIFGSFLKGPPLWP